MSKSDTDSNSGSYKSLSDEDSKMMTAREDDGDSTSEVESSDETVDDLSVNKAKSAPAQNINENCCAEEKQTNCVGACEKINSNVNIKKDVDKSTPIADADDASTSLKSVDAKSNTDINVGSSTSRTKYSRGEKKARRLLIKQGAKPLPNISRLVMRQGNVLFVIDEAEVYKNPRSDTFIVFGEVKIEDVAKQQENILASSHIKAAQTIAEVTKLHATKPLILADEEAEDGLDETGIDPLDINLVMTQASTTRAKAVRALKANDNDIVNAIMELTM